MASTTVLASPMAQSQLGPAPLARLLRRSSPDDDARRAGMRALAPPSFGAASFESTPSDMVCCSSWGEGWPGGATCSRAGAPRAAAPAAAASTAFAVAAAFATSATLASTAAATLASTAASSATAASAASATFAAAAAFAAPATLAAAATFVSSAAFAASAACGCGSGAGEPCCGGRRASAWEDEVRWCTRVGAEARARMRASKG